VCVCVCVCVCVRVCVPAAQWPAWRARDPRSLPPGLTLPPCLRSVVEALTAHLLAMAGDDASADVCQAWAAEFRRSQYLQTTEVFRLLQTVRAKTPAAAAPARVRRAGFSFINVFI
jgi:hypothetical protein